MFLTMVFIMPRVEAGLAVLDDLAAILKLEEELGRPATGHQRESARHALGMRKANIQRYVERKIDEALSRKGEALSYLENELTAVSKSAPPAVSGLMSDLKQNIMQKAAIEVNKSRIRRMFERHKMISVILAVILAFVGMTRCSAVDIGQPLNSKTGLSNIVRIMDKIDLYAKVYPKYDRVYGWYIAMISPLQPSESELAYLDEYAGLNVDLYNSMKTFGRICNDDGLISDETSDETIARLIRASTNLAIAHADSKTALGDLIIGAYESLFPCQESK